LAKLYHLEFHCDPIYFAFARDMVFLLLFGAESADSKGKDDGENCPMLESRETCYFGKNRAIPGIRRRRGWKVILTLAIALLIVATFREAWNGWLITSVVHKFKPILFDIWNMLHNVLVACKDF
jgi:hypothetical protein